MKTLILAICMLSTGLMASAQKPVNFKSHEDKLNELYCTGLFKSTHGTVLDVASDNTAMAYPNILNWLQGRVAGLQIYTNRYGVPVPVIRGNIPGIYLNEIQVQYSFLNSIASTDIAMIKIIKTPFYGGFNGGGGAIAIYTFGTEDEEFEHDEG